MAGQTPPVIETYGAGGFRVSGRRIEGSIVLLGEVARPWPVTTLKALQAADFADIIAAGLIAVELVLLGTGTQTAVAPRPIRDALKQAGLGLDMMNTPEACRLYNVLAADGRRVAAALLAV